MTLQEEYSQVPSTVNYVFQKIELVSETASQLKGNYSTILKIHHDKNNVTWLSTAGGGIVKILEGSGFKNISNQINNNELKDFLNCTSITKANNKIFIGTLLKGVFYGESYNNLKKIEKVGDVKINTFYVHNNNLYIGTAEGFSIFNSVWSALSKIAWASAPREDPFSFNNTVSYVSIYYCGLYSFRW